MIKYIKYLFFLILFLSFSKGVHADGLNCNFGLFNVYNNLTDSYDVWYLNEDTQSRDIGSPTYENVGSATRSKIGNVCISSYEMNSKFVSNQFFGYVIGFYDKGNGSRFFLPGGQEQVFTLYLDTRAYNLYNSYGLRLEAYDDSVGSSRTIKTFNYSDNCKSENHTIGNSSFTYKCDFKYSFPTDKYLTLYVRSSSAMTNYLALSIGYSFNNYYDNINDAINNMTDKITQEQDKTNQKLDDINSSITNDSPVSMDKLGNTAGWLPAGPVDSILNLPLSLMNSLSTSLNKQCSPLQINVPYIDTQVQIPCLSTIFNQIEGLPNFWSWVGAIASCLILYKYLLNLYAWVDNVLMLRLEMHEDFGGNSTNFGSV